jgi:hypothetical protein
MKIFILSKISFKPGLNDTHPLLTTPVKCRGFQNETFVFSSEYLNFIKSNTLRDSYYFDLSQNKYLACLTNSTILLEIIIFTKTRLVYIAKN